MLVFDFTGRDRSISVGSKKTTLALNPYLFHSIIVIKFKYFRALFLLLVDIDLSVSFFPLQDFEP
jgi:hypothetical protein